MKVIRYKKKYQSSWDEFISSSRNGTFLLSRNFIEYHKDRFSDYSLMIVDNNNNILALLPSSLKDKSSVVSHEGLTYGGLIISNKTKLVDTINYFKLILKFLNNNKIKFLEYKCIPPMYHGDLYFDDQYVMFLLDAKITRIDTSLTLDLNSNFDFQKRRKRSINKSKKNEVVIKKSTSFKEFWIEILEPNLLLKHNVKPVHSLKEIEYLHNLFPNRILQYNAEFDGEILAGTTLFICNKVVHAQYISSNDQGRKIGAIDHLFDYLINDEFKNINYFSFGICNENQGKKINKGLLDWKESFGSKVFLNSFYSVETNKFNLLNDL